MSLETLLTKYEPDGAAHFSTMKSLAESAQHFRHALENPLKPSKAMRIGTIVHRLVLGPQREHDVVTFDGTRQGTIWKLFAKAHAKDLIVTASEWEEAEPIAKAVLRNADAMSILENARLEVPLKWENNGVPCSTRGIDIVGAARNIADLKTAASVNPRKFMRHGERMFYHVQLAHYEEGAKQNGIDTSGGVSIVAVESKPPYAVQIFEMTPALLDWGNRELALWIGRLKSCAEIDHWPAYSQSPIRWDPPVYAIDEDDEEEEAA